MTRPPSKPGRRSRWTAADVPDRSGCVVVITGANAGRGAPPMLRAAGDPAARGGEFYGPHRRHDTGFPVVVRASPRSRDVAHQARPWEVSEQLTGMRCRFGADPP